MRENGEEGEEAGAPFSVMSHSDEPPESRGSAKLPHDLFYDFSLWCHPPPRVCFSHMAGQHLSHFIDNGDAYHTARCAGSTDIASPFCSWAWFYIHFCGFHYPGECRLLLILHFLKDFFGFHFLSLPSPRWALIPLLLCSAVIGSRMLKGA